MIQIHSLVLYNPFDGTNASSKEEGVASKKLKALSINEDWCKGCGDQVHLSTEEFLEKLDENLQKKMLC